MSEIRFKAYKQQAKFIQDKSRVIMAAGGKRSGKTEMGAIRSIMYQERKPNFQPKSVDPYIGVIIAPTMDMLRRLSMKKFLAYAKPFIKNYNKSTFEVEWHDGSLVYGLSADRPQRIEGIKAHWGWL